MQLKIGFFIAAGAMATKADDSMFQSYCAKYGKHYDTKEEYEMR
jgi:hypothetical protein